MSISIRVPGYLSALTILALSVALPSMADAKPCCERYGRTSNSSSAATCRRIGGHVVSQRYCQNRNYRQDGNDNGVNFSITLGNVQFGYNDGYYDQNRGWHSWKNNGERDWYRQNHRQSYYDVTHDRDGDQNRKDWRDGKRNDWRGGGDRN